MLMLPVEEHFCNPSAWGWLASQPCQLVNFRFNERQSQKQSGEVDEMAQ